MRKSISHSQVPQGARRISSFEPSHSQPSNQFSRQSIATTNRSSMSNFSSRRSSSAATSGRVSTCGGPSGSKGGQNELKVLNGNELASSIFEILQDLDYGQPISMKTLLIPSTGTFYTLFEYFMKTIGYTEIWNFSILPQDPHKGGPLVGGKQQQQMNPATLNKLKFEMILYHLNFLRYSNIPKINVLQSMTTPKNWLHILHILQFLGNVCLFNHFYDGHKLIYTFDRKEAEVINEYLKISFNLLKTQNNYLSDDEAKLKKEYLEKYEHRLKDHLNLKKLNDEVELLQKNHEHLRGTMTRLDDAVVEEQSLVRKLNDLEQKLNNNINKTNEKLKGNKKLKKELQVSRERLEQYEKEKSIKDALYDKQLASGNQTESLAKRSTQKIKELESLQNSYVELEERTDELHSKLLQKTHNAKEAICESNELVNKIKLSSSLVLNEFPQLDVIDLHQKSDIIKEFKESFIKIREEYNQKICKLPEQSSQLREEKKMIETKIERGKMKANHLEDDCKRMELNYTKITQESAKLIQDSCYDLELKQDKLKKVNEQIKFINDQMAHNKVECDKALNEYNKIKEDAESKHSEVTQHYEHTKRNATQELCEHQGRTTDVIKDIYDYLLKEQKLAFDFIKQNNLTA